MESAKDLQGRILLVDDESAILRTFRYCLEDEGYTVATANSAAQADASVTVTGGALEGSNVSAVEAMVDMISLGRSFETQMSLLKNAENNAAKAAQILSLT